MDSRAREHEHEQERRPAERQPEPAPKEAAPAERLASAVGNQAFGSLIARQGAGILPDGRAEPVGHLGVRHLESRPGDAVLRVDLRAGRRRGEDESGRDPRGDGDAPGHWAGL